MADEIDAAPGPLAMHFIDPVKEPKVCINIGDRRNFRMAAQQMPREAGRQGEDVLKAAPCFPASRKLRIGFLQIREGQYPQIIATKAGDGRRRRLVHSQHPQRHARIMPPQ